MGHPRNDPPKMRPWNYQGSIVADKVKRKLKHSSTLLSQGSFTQSQAQLCSDTILLESGSK